MKFILFLIINIIISIIVEKRSKIMTVAHAIMFSFLLAFSLFMCDIPLITNTFANLIGSEYYDILNAALIEKVEIAGLKYSTLGLLEVLISIEILIVVLVAQVKLVQHFIVYKKLVPIKFDKHVNQIQSSYANLRRERIILKYGRIRI